MIPKINPKIIEQLLHFILLGQPSLSLSFIQQLNYSSDEIIYIIQKVMEQLGILWQNNKVALTQIVVAGMIIERYINELTTIKDNSVKNDGEGRVWIILGTIEEDYHSLGKELLRIFLTPYFNVVDLGINVAPEQFIASALQYSASVIAVSALMMNSVSNIKKIRELMISTEWSKKKPLLIVGGAPFNIDPYLWERVGADLMISSVVGAPEIITQILKEEYPC